MSSEEEWRPVVGWEGLYEVSSHGRVRSLDRRVNSGRGGTRLIPGKILKAQSNIDGYNVYGLSKNHRQKVQRGARLVAEAFLEKPTDPKRQFVLHWDGSKDRDHVGNLRWGSLKENAEDMVRHGTNSRAGRTHCRNGHEYSPETTGIRADNGSRICYKCERDSARRSRNKAKGKEPPTHGTLNGYIDYQCRCDRCKANWSEYQGKRRGIGDCTAPTN